MANKAYSLLCKIANMRKKCLQKKVGITNGTLPAKYSQLQNYVNCTANYSEAAIKAYIKKNYNDLLMIIPRNNAAQKLIDELKTMAQ